ncbi:MAG: zinc-dependent peptidase, partial [Methyloversatilis sp.]|nr:zinc-dependent peptidase [Methyloversatilis sp.]
MFHWLRRALAPADADLPEVTPDTWARIEARLPFLDYLEPADRPVLRELARQFIASRQFHGAHDMVLHDDQLVEIALQACLPILRLGLDWY